jgi:hypothetical protein
LPTATEKSIENSEKVSGDEEEEPKRKKKKNRRKKNRKKKCVCNCHAAEQPTIDCKCCDPGVANGASVADAEVEGKRGECTDAGDCAQDEGKLTQTNTGASTNQ